jgi:predicted transcriptional regulator
MLKRDRIEIIALILQACSEPSTATKITYLTLLNFRQVTVYIDYLVRLKLLERSIQTRTYTITDKGRQYLDLYNIDMRKLVSASSSNNNCSEEQAKLSVTILGK